MARTPDRFPGEREDEGMKLDVGSVHPTQNGEVFYIDGVGFKFFEEGVEVGLSGTGISEATHRTLRQLIHLADGDGPYEGFASGAYKETTGTVFPTAVIWWESSAKLKKVVEKLITWTGAFPTTIAWKAYDAAGSLLVTVTDTVSYSGPFETSRTRVIS
jgi:hypothetical protein